VRAYVGLAAGIEIDEGVPSSTILAEDARRVNHKH
jgi:hypothetical protein